MPAKPTICNHPSAGTLEKADKPLGTSANLMSSADSSACAKSNRDLGQNHRVFSAAQQGNETGTGL